MRIKNILSLLLTLFIMLALFSCSDDPNIGGDVPTDTAQTESSDTSANDTSPDSDVEGSETGDGGAASDPVTEQSNEGDGGGETQPPSDAGSGGSNNGGGSSGGDSSISGGAGGSAGGGASGGSGGSGGGSGGNSGGGSGGSSGGNSGSNNDGGDSGGNSGGDSGGDNSGIDTSKFFGPRVDTSPDYPVGGEDNSWTVPSFPIRNSLASDPNADYNTPRIPWANLVPGVEVNGVTIGYNGWMFYKDSLRDYVGTSKFTDIKADTIVRMMNERVSYIEGTLGMKIYFVIPPNKNTIYPEYMPESYTMGGYRKIDQVCDLLRNQVGISVIDLRDALYAAKKATPERNLYYKTDTHWNNHAGYIAYTEVMNAIKQDFPNAVYHPKSDYQINYYETYMKDQLYHLGYFDSVKEIGPQYTLKNPCNTSLSYQTCYPGGQWQFAYKRPDGYHDYLQFYTYTNYTNSGAPSIYMMRDSFSVAMAGFVKDSFYRSTFDWTFVCWKDHIRDLNADILLIEVAERNLDNFFNLTAFRNGKPY